MTAPAPFLFDLDGTLADTLADIAASTDHVRAGFGLPPLGLAGVRPLVGDGARALIERALGELDGPASEQAASVELGLRRYLEHHEQQCTVHARAYPGVHEHLERLRRAGHPLAVVTNKPVRFARRIVAQLGLDQLLPVVVGGDSLPVRKPDPAPLRVALQSLGQPEDCGTMVGDGEGDLRAGRAAGLGTIACLYGYGEPLRLRAQRPDLCWQAFGVPAD